MITIFPFLTETMYIITRTYIKNLRHSSLQMNIIERHVKLQTGTFISKRDIFDKKIKSENCIFCIWECGDNSCVSYELKYV